MVTHYSRNNGATLSFGQNLDHEHDSLLLIQDFMNEMRTKLDSV